jgi:hypothetical protein
MVAAVLVWRSTGVPRAPVTPAVAVAVHAEATTQPLPSSSSLVPWAGPVEQLFFHPLVRDPSLAFTPDQLGRGFAHYFVTAREFGAILDGLWRNGWTMVDVHRAAAGTVLVPPGRKPFVLSEDDVNYYDYFAGRGLASRLVVDASDDVRAEFPDGVSNDDLVPLVEAEVAAHPEFSAEGAKGVLGLTGYQGLFGEHDLSDPAAARRVRALVARLRGTGWTMASHTFGHINLSRDSQRVISRDTARWLELTQELLGPVDVLIYPFGARPSAAARRVLRDAGFTIQLDIDTRAAHSAMDGVTTMSRRHVDGLAFDEPSRLARFFDVAAVRDPARP